MEFINTFFMQLTMKPFTDVFNKALTKLY